MFERNKINNSERGAMAVEVTLDDGRELHGQFIIPAGRELIELLNGAACFIEFEFYSGERFYLAKAMLRSVKLVNAPRQQNLMSRLRDIDGFDPYQILGLAPPTSWKDVRQAYLSLAKAYHPDRYASVELPVEVVNYLSAMATRINAAYRALEQPHHLRKQASETAA
jgi:hypothetical protein